MSTPDNTRLGHDSAADEWQDRLSDYLDDELEAFELEALERHLAQCDSCSRALADLRVLVARASQLKRPVVPTHDLWPAVVVRLRPRAARHWPALTGRAHPVRWLVPRLAAAAVLLLACAVAVFWLRRPQPAATPVPEGPRVAVAHESPADVAFEDSVAHLRRLAHARLQADPQVITVLEDNLSALDRAIAEYRDALAERPGDPALKRRLDDALARKLELLQRVAGTNVEGTN